MSIRAELANILAGLKCPQLFDRDQIRAHMHAALDTLDLAYGGNVSPTARSAMSPPAIANLIADSLILAAHVGGFDLHEGLRKAFADRGLPFDVPQRYKPWNHPHGAEQLAREIGLRIEDANVSMMIFGVPEHFANLDRDKLSRAVAATQDRVDPSIFMSLNLDGRKVAQSVATPKLDAEAMHRKDLERRDAIIEAAFKALESHIYTFENLSVQGPGGKSQIAQKRIPQERLAHCVDQLMKSLAAVQVTCGELRAARAKAEAETNQTNVKLSKCMQALETVRVGKVGDEVATCVSIADIVHSMRKDLADSNTRGFEQAKSIARAETNLQNEKTRFAEYRRNAEMVPKRVADLERKLAVAAMEDTITIHVFPRDGRIVITGWRIDGSPNFDRLSNKVRGMIMNAKTIQALTSEVTRTLNETCPNVVKSAEPSEEHNGFGTPMRIVIKINAKIRDAFVFGKAADYSNANIDRMLAQQNDPDEVY